MTSRSELVYAHVQAWLPFGERGAESKKRCLEYIELVADPFEREMGDEHITGSAVVMSTAGVLLHKHKLNGIWMGPGGHVDAGELPSDAAVRETLEETGIVAWHPAIGPTLVHVDTHETSNQHIHHDLRFALLAMPDTPEPGPGESPEVAWVLDDEAHDMTDGSYSYALVKALGLSLQRP